MITSTQSQSVQLEKVARLYADYEAAIYCHHSHIKTIRSCLSDAIARLAELDADSAENWIKLTWKTDKTIH